MKILELAPYIFIKDHPYASKNQSGLAYMIRGITDMLSQKHDVYVLTQSVITAEHNVGKWTLLRRNLLDVIFNIRFKYLNAYFNHSKQGCSLSKHIYVLFYYLSGGHVESVINKLNPDVIHIHGIGDYTVPYLIAASQFKIPVVVTLHGLYSFNNITHVSPLQKKTEKEFLKLWHENNYDLTFISSGMKRKMSEYLESSVNVKVIPNAFEISDSLNITPEKQKEVLRLICIGSLSDLKNHIQVIRTLPQVQKSFINKRVSLDIVGDGIKREYLESYVKDNNISEVRFHGRLPHEEVYRLLSSSDVLVFPSIEEGFGMPIIEAYYWGVPVVAFKDIDAYEDVYNAECLMPAEDRSDKALEKAIIKALNREWNKEKIRSFSAHFTHEKIGEMYDKTICDANTPIDYKVVKQLL